MIVKAVEIRDRATFIPALIMRSAWQNAEQLYLYRRSGHDEHVVIMMDLNSHEATPDPYGWRSPSRTYRVAHEYCLGHFDQIKDGDVIDVQHILGETPTKKESERKQFPV